MKFPSLLYVSLLIFLSLFTSAFASDFDSKKDTISVSTGTKSGNITYQIGGYLSDGSVIEKAHFPISELKFPRNFEMLQLGFSFNATNNWNLILELEANFSNNNGVMVDRDWLSANRLDIYSESKTSVTAREILFEISRKLSPLHYSKNHAPLHNLMGFGVLAQLYDYRAFDTVQSYPSSDLATIEVDGNVILYKFMQVAPFASYTIFHRVKSTLQFESRTLISPFLFIEDKDNHLKRDKVSQSSTRGWVAHSSLKVYWDFSKILGLFAQADYQLFEANGKQAQTNESKSGKKEYQIKVKHLGEQTNFRIGLNFYF